MQSLLTWLRDLIWPNRRYDRYCIGCGKVTAWETGRHETRCTECGFSFGIRRHR